MKGEQVSRMMIARLEQVPKDATDVACTPLPTVEVPVDSATKRETAVHQNEKRNKNDLFRNNSTPGPLNRNKKNDIDARIAKMLVKADENGLLPERKDDLHIIITENTAVCRTTFFFAPSAKV